MARHSRVGLLAPLQEQILGLMLLRPSREWYRSELARELSVAPSSLQRPLGALTRSRIVTTRRDGNRIYYGIDATHPIVPELKSMLAKTSGLVHVLRESLAGVRANIRVAFVFGSIAAGTEGASSDVDLLVLGALGLADLAKPLRRASDKLGREINPSVYSVDDFAAKLAARNRFLSALLDKPRLFVIGTNDELEEIARRKPRGTGALRS